ERRSLLSAHQRTRKDLSEIDPQARHEFAHAVCVVTPRGSQHAVEITLRTFYAHGGSFGMSYKIDQHGQLLRKGDCDSRRSRTPLPDGRFHRDYHTGRWKADALR